MTHRSKTLLSTLLIAGAFAGTVAGPARAADDTALRLSNVSAGDNAYVRVANNPDFTLSAFTLEAWVQRVGAGYGHSTDGLGAAIISKPQEGHSGSYLGSWHVNWTNAGQMIFTVVHTAGSSGVFLTAPAVATPLGRHHLAATFDGDTLRTYVDGALAAQAGWSLGTIYYGPDDVLIGAQNFAGGFERAFDGFIDDVRVWNYARTPGQIAGAMNCRPSGSEAGLVAYWTFNALDLADVTGHGHGGTVGGIPSSLSYASLVSIPGCAFAGVEELPPSAATATPTAIAPSMAVYPQPTSGRFTVSFELPREGFVTAELFEVGGRKVATLASRRFPAGHHELLWDLAGPGETGPATRMLYVRLDAGGERLVRPLVLLR